MSQIDRVLRASRSYRGVCQAELLGTTVDGGPNITRLAARIQDLEDQGYVFEIVGVRFKCKVYRLLSEPFDAEGGQVDGSGNPDTGLQASPAALSATDTLFEVPAAKPKPRGPYDLEAA